MADRPAHRGPPDTEIEITPEMIEAGARVLCGFETYFTDEAYWAKEVYLAMARCRSAGVLKPQRRFEAALRGAREVGHKTMDDLKADKPKKPKRKSPRKSTRKKRDR